MLLTFDYLKDLYIESRKKGNKMKQSNAIYIIRVYCGNGKNKSFQVFLNQYICVYIETISTYIYIIELIIFVYYFAPFLVLVNKFILNF